LVHAAVMAELAERGYGRLSVESVAERAGVHRTTVYRRWPSVAALVLDAVPEEVARQIPLPDTGSVAQDLRELMQATTAVLGSPQGSALVRAVALEAPYLPELRDLAQQFWAGRFGLVRDVVLRGVARGELPADTDADLLVETLVAPLYLRTLVTQQPVDAAYADRVLDAVLPSVPSGPS
jgi:AcrR family transcriptional regulator